MTQTEYGDRCRMWPHRWTAAQASRFSGYLTRLDAGSRPPPPAAAGVFPKFGQAGHLQNIWAANWPLSRSGIVLQVTEGRCFND